MNAGAEIAGIVYYSFCKKRSFNHQYITKSKYKLKVQQLKKKIVATRSTPANFRTLKEYCSKLNWMIK